MGRLRKPKPVVKDIAKFLQGSAVLVALLVFFSTFSYIAAIGSFVAMIALAFTVQLTYRRIKHKRFLESGLDVVDKMSGTDFEEFLQVHFKQLGYKAQTTPVTGDYGADLVLEKDGIKTVVQAKRWGQKVGVEAVQQILAAMGYYKACKAIVITNNYCSENAHVLANANNIEIWDRDSLQKFMNKTNGKASAVYVAGNSNYSPDICPECAGKLIAKKMVNTGTF
jgi:restriction system protein